MRFYIETDRLILRDLQPADDQGMFRLDSDPDVHRYVGNKPVTAVEQSREVIEIIRCQYDINGIGRWAVVEKSSGDFIGWSGLKLITEPIDGRSGYLDLGYRFIKQYWGKGYAKETAKAAAAYAWNVLNADILCGIAQVQNIASIKVLESAGLRFTHYFDYEDAPHAWYETTRPSST